MGVTWEGTLGAGGQNQVEWRGPEDVGGTKSAEDRRIGK